MKKTFKEIRQKVAIDGKSREERINSLLDNPNLIENLNSGLERLKLEDPNEAERMQKLLTDLGLLEN